MANLERLLSTSCDKVVLVGDVGVGKTTLFNRFSKGQFVETTGTQSRTSELQKKWELNGKEVSITLYDTAGMERHLSTIPHTYFRYAKVVALVYSIDDSDTFDSLTNWVDNATSARVSMGQSDPITILVGNKVDLDSQRCVPLERALQFAVNNDISAEMVFEVSAKENINIQTLFNTIAIKVHPYAALQHMESEPVKKHQCC